MRAIQENLAQAFADLNPSAAATIGLLLAKGEKPSKIKRSIAAYRDTLTGGCAEAYIDWKAAPPQGDRDAATAGQGEE